MSVFQNSLLAAAAAAASAPSGPAGSMWACGQNTQGQFGNSANSNAYVCSPVQVGGDETDWEVVISTDQSTMAVKNGLLFCWGDQVQIPDGTNTSRNSPVQIGSLTDWSSEFKKLDGGEEQAIAVKTDGTLWGWGGNGTGAIGDGSTTKRTSPVQIGSLTDWDIIACGERSSGGIKTDNTIWTWGSNGKGELGLGDTTNRSSPVQIGTLTDWADIAMNASGGAAVKTDGTLWQWGNEETVGDSVNVNRSSPVQIGTETYWSRVYGPDAAFLMTTTNNTLFANGNGIHGVMGNGSTSNKNSPVQIGSLTDWDKLFVYGRRNSVYALKTDSTLWSWGRNAAGQLGLGDKTDRCSPVQVGTETDWMMMNAGSYAAVGIREV